jgi:hypothetical protein
MQAHLHFGHSIYMKGGFVLCTLHDLRGSSSDLLTLLEVVVCTREEFHSAHLEETARS